MLRKGAVPEFNFFMHNSPVMLLIGWVSRHIDAYFAWIIVNSICHFTVALCIYLISLRYSSKSVSTAVTGFYLISPIALWQTINPLLEMYFAALVGVQLLCFFYREKTACKYLLYITLLVGLMSHPIFLAPAFLWGLWAIVERSGKNVLIDITLASLYFGMVVLCLKFKSYWFPSSFQPEMKAIIASAVPGSSNMFWHYSEQLPVIDMTLFKLKVGYALKKQFLVAKMAPFYLFTNIALAIAVYLALFRFSKWWRVLIPLGLFGCQYVSLIFLQQNHPRYQQIVACVTFVLIGIGLNQFIRRSNVGRKYFPLGVFAVSVVVIALTFTVVQYGRTQSLSEAKEIERLEHELAAVPDNARIVGINIKPHNPFSYIVRPRQMLFIRTDMLDQKQSERAIDLFDPDYFVVRLSDEYQTQGKFVKRFDTKMFGKLAVYSVK